MEESNYSGRRFFSIPDVLLNATIAHETTNSSNTPKTRLLNLLAYSQQMRPVYAPCHPIDLEGLEETAV